jgi:hypothetical protein
MPTRLTPKETEILGQIDLMVEQDGVTAVKNAFFHWWRSRVPADRVKRKQFKWPQDYKRLYDRQKGICPECEQAMPFIRGEIEVDHLDPFKEDFGDRINLRVTHKSPCNRKKGSSSLMQQAKRTGKTVRQILEEQKGIS